MALAHAALAKERSHLVVAVLGADFERHVLLGRIIRTNSTSGTLLAPDDGETCGQKPTFELCGTIATLLGSG